MMLDEKHNVDSSAPTLRNSKTPSLEEKDTAQVPITAERPLSSSSSSLPASKDGDDLKKIKSASEVQEELTKVMTSGEGIEYPTGLRLGLLTLALCLSVFLMALDNTIIATAIPKITDQFNSLGDVGWYGSSYLLTTASFQLFFGKLYTYMSIKWVYLSAIFIFEVGSAICGAAPNSITLIIGRAIAGIGSAGIFSGALIIIAYSVPLHKRPMFSGFIGAMYGIASVAGPLMGGVFTDKVTWRWCFYINLPLGAITVAVIIFYFQNPDRAAVADLGWAARIKEFDLEGTAVFIPSIICLLLALQWGGTQYAWGSWRIILLFVLFGLLISTFIAIQVWKKDKATVPMRIISKRSIWAAAWFAFALGAAFMLLVFYLPIWFQAVKGASAVKSGIMNLPLILGLVIVSIIGGIAVTVLGYYAPLMIASSVIMAIGAGLLTTLEPDSGHAKWIGYQAFTGIGIGLGMQQPLIAVQTVLDIKDVPTATSIIVFAQTLGGALFVSIGQNVFGNKLVSGLAANAPDIDPYIILHTGATSIQSAVDPSVLPGVTQAYSDALTMSFLVAAVMFAATIVGSGAIEWKSVKGKKIEMAGGA